MTRAEGPAFYAAVGPIGQYSLLIGDPPGGCMMAPATVNRIPDRHTTRQEGQYGRQYRWTVRRCSDQKTVLPIPIWTLDYARCIYPYLYSIFHILNYICKLPTDRRRIKHAGSTVAPPPGSFASYQSHPSITSPDGPSRTVREYILALTLAEAQVEPHRVVLVSNDLNPHKQQE